ncbi:MAG: NAD-dependent epimerase/dehydratase family protein [Christensenellales bacterium]|jgi:dihydroflavonol-4-reductase
MSVLITGVTGHIGNVLARRLSCMGVPLRVLVLPGESVTPLEGICANIIVADIRNEAEVRRAVAGCEYVFHLAGIIDITDRNADVLYDVNVLGTKNILKACRLERVRRLIYTSSIHALRDDVDVIDEHLALDLRPDMLVGHYAKSKAIALSHVQDAVKNGLDAVTVYPTGVIGPDDYRLSEIGRLLSYLTKHPRRRTQLGFEGAYNFVDVRDVVEGLILAWKKAPAGSDYILSGDRISVEEIFHICAGQTGRRIKVRNVPLIWVKMASGILAALSAMKLLRKKPLITRTSLHTLQVKGFIDSGKARRELGFEPRPIRETICDSIRWLQKTSPARRRSRRQGAVPQQG